MVFFLIFTQNNQIKISQSFLTFLAVKSTEATRGGLPSNDNDALTTSTAFTATEGTAATLVEAAQSIITNSSNSISCWDALSESDRTECKKSGVLTPGCPRSQICKRVGDTCGYVCEDSRVPQPCGDDDHIGKLIGLLIFSIISNNFVVWNLLLNPVSGDNPTENLKECDLADQVINESKFGFTCDNVNGHLGFINLPHIPKSHNYAELDKREIKILQADRYNDYLEAVDNASFYSIFQNSACVADQRSEGQFAFDGAFENDACLALSETIEDENGDVWDVKQ